MLLNYLVVDCQLDVVIKTLDVRCEQNIPLFLPTMFSVFPLAHLDIFNNINVELIFVYSYKE